MRVFRRGRESPSRGTRVRVRESRELGDWDARSRCKAADRNTARRALADGGQACKHCRPDIALGVLD
ncbi:DUF6233 domain-containing protein [Streptomyces sp. NPDC002812]|uniref:DUF6233 domain-containing protein n=1 Tax=Streptomyces sp. NPDC002812 TaxID=3154434 RepID=UPI00332A93C1